MAVRNESVRLTLDDAGYTTGMARAAAATSLLDRSLNDLDGSSVRTKRGLADTAVGVDGIDRSARRAEPSINQLTGRLTLLAQAASALGPALIPVGAVGAVGVAGLASGLAAAAVAGGSAIVAFQGVGDAVKAVAEAELDPTVANLEKAQEATAKLGPDARRFVQEFQDFRPVLTDIRDAAARGWFPGVTESLDDFERLAPKVITLFENVGRAGGEAVASGADSLASGRWSEFFDFLADEAPATITQLSSIVGDLTHGLAEMWMSFDPGNDAFLSWVGDVADEFDSWASSASGREDIESFLAYAAQTGPDVANAFGSLVNMLVQVTQAAAPLGGPVLNAISAVADVVAAIADSNLGTPIFTSLAAMTLLTRATALWGAASTTAAGKFVAGQVLAQNAAGKTTVSMAGIAKSAGLLAAAYVAVQSGSGIIDSFSRQSAAADSAGASFEDLKKNLEASNVGKYAQDFGIDINRLATEMSQFGTRGDYYSEVIGKMNSANDGLTGRGKQLGDFLNPFIGSTEKASLATYDLKNILEGLEETTPTDSVNGFASIFGIAAGSMDEAKNSAAALQNQLVRLNEALSGRSNWRDYQAAIDGVTASIKDNGRTLNRHTEEGRANEAALDGIAASALALAENMKGANRVRFLNRAREDFIAAGRELGLLPKKAQALADKLGLVHRTRVAPTVKLDTAQAESREDALRRRLTKLSQMKPTPKVNAEIAEALGKLATVQSALNGLQDENVFVNIIRRNAGGASVGPAARADKGASDGATVPKDGLPYADRHHYMLAGGEEVISNRRGQADMNRAALKAANAGARLTVIGGLADGGTAGRGSSLWIPGMSGLPDFNPLTASLRELNRALNRSEKAVDRERKQRDDLISKRGEVASGIAGGLTADIWAGPSNPWAAGASSDPTAALQASTAQAREFTKIIKTLKQRGLDGAALAEVIGSGDIERARMMASLPASALRQFETAYNQNRQAVAAAGAAGGQAAYGAQIAEQTRELQGARRELRQIKAAIKAKERNDHKSRRENADRTTKGVNGAAGGGKRDRVYAG